MKSLTESQLRDLVYCDLCGTCGLDKCQYPSAHEAVGKLTINWSDLKYTLSQIPTSFEKREDKLVALGGQSSHSGSP